MQYDHDNRDEWLAWFLNPSTNDEKVLAAALSTVPAKHWLFVDTRLDEALDDAKDQFLPKSEAPIYLSERDAARYELLNRKEQLLWKARLLWRERANRARKVAGSLADVDIPGWETSESAAEWVRASRQVDEARLRRILEES